MGTPSNSGDLNFQPMTIDHQIQELEQQLKRHRFAAVERNEPPNGFNRKRAEDLEIKLRKLQDKRQPQSDSNNFLYNFLAFLLITTCLYSHIMIEAGKDELKTNKLNPSRPVKEIKTPTPSAKPAIQNPDPALAMQGRFYGSKLGGAYSRLDAGFTNYQRLSGTLARIQAVALKKRSEAMQLPAVWINRTREDCFDRSSIGVYDSQCQVIKLDYSDGHSTYEHPVEMEVTLAHEWGHHLIALSDVAMSPTEQEVVSDCFAGAVFGYYVRNRLITLQEAARAIDMVAYVGNNSAYGHHPNRETRLRSFMGGLASVSDPTNLDTATFAASCPGLHQVVDTTKIRGMGLRWKP